MINIGLIINPFAGLGGSVGLKGSDGDDIVAEAIHRGARPRAQLRARQALELLIPYAENLHFYGYDGSMGGDLLAELGLPLTLLGQPASRDSTAQDTRKLAQELLRQNVDIVVFAGGDGTARDIYDVVGEHIPVLGIPAGVKMHSGVFGMSPQAAGQVLQQLVTGGLVDVAPGEVRDIDEQGLREGRLGSRYYGELLVPAEGRFLQRTKVSGQEVEELVVADMAAEVVRQIEDDVLYLVGPGTTANAVLDELGLPATLLGVDVVLNQQLLASDATGPQLVELLDSHQGEACLIIGVAGGQGHMLGRGNQQLGPELLRRVGIKNIIVLATKTKLKALEGRPLLVDTGDEQLDQQLCGFRRIITGYSDSVMYRVARDYS
jgi:predicted polyphosphate/ATP-dependent NAD kinase